MHATNSKTAKDRVSGRARFLLDAAKEASATLLNRLTFDGRREQVARTELDERLWTQLDEGRGFVARPSNTTAGTGPRSICQQSKPSAGRLLILKAKVECASTVGRRKDRSRSDLALSHA